MPPHQYARVRPRLLTGAARASSVTNVTVTNTPPLAAAGACTIYIVGFTATSPAGSLSRASNDQITKVSSSGMGRGTVVNSAVTDRNTSQSVGNCSVSAARLIPTCGLFGGDTIRSGHGVSVELDGTNPSSSSTTETVSAPTTSDRSLVTWANYTVVAASQISRPVVVDTPPTAAAAGQTISHITILVRAGHHYLARALTTHE